MKRTTTLTLAATMLALAGCSSTSSPVAGQEQQPTVAAPTTVTVSSVATAKAVSSPKPTPSTAATCPDRPDIYLWMRTDGAPDTTQRLGGTDPQTCKPSFDLFASTAPTVPGSCTEGAWVSDNPGYDESATPSKRLKKVQFSVGPAC